jgi:hypothetical protein
MRRVLDMMGSALTDTWTALVTAVGGEVLLAVIGVALVLAAVGVLLSLFPRGNRNGGPAHPEVLISKGEIVSRQGDGALMLRLTVSNLNLTPLQLLELSVQMSELPAPLTTEVAALIAPQGAVDLTAELEDVEGDEGTLELYVYASENRRKTYRVSAQLLWEPWNGRYKVSPLGQRVEPVRSLASTRSHREQLASWRRRIDVDHDPDGTPILDEDVFSTVDLPGDGSNGEAPNESGTRRRDRDDEGVPLDFPSDF